MAAQEGGRSCSEDDAQLCVQAGTVPCSPLLAGFFSDCKKNLLFPPSLVMPVSVDLHFSCYILMGEKNTKRLDLRPWASVSTKEMWSWQDSSVRLVAE